MDGTEEVGATEGWMVDGAEVFEAGATEGWMVDGAEVFEVGATEAAWLHA